MWALLISAFWALSIIGNTCEDCSMRNGALHSTASDKATER